jgi:hypothetical protein
VQLLAIEVVFTRLLCPPPLPTRTQLQLLVVEVGFTPFPPPPPTHTHSLAWPFHTLAAFQPACPS